MKLYVTDQRERISECTRTRILDFQSERVYFISCGDGLWRYISYNALHVCFSVLLASFVLCIIFLINIIYLLVLPFIMIKKESNKLKEQSIKTLDWYWVRFKIAHG